jgi:hypothetical protein
MTGRECETRLFFLAHALDKMRSAVPRIGRPTKDIQMTVPLEYADDIETVCVQYIPGTTIEKVPLTRVGPVKMRFRMVL